MTREAIDRFFAVVACPATAAPITAVEAATRPVEKPTTKVISRFGHKRGSGRLENGGCMVSDWAT